MTSEARTLQARSLPGDFQVSLLVLLLIGLAVAVCWVFAEVPTLSDDPFRLMAFAVMACSVIVLGILVLVQQCIRFKLERGGSMVLLFMLFSIFTATIDLCITSSLLHFTRLGDFYISRGEEYFSTPAGSMCLMWDATIHLVLQAIVVRNFLQQRPYAHYLLVWAGSVVASMPPLLIGAATGSFAERIHASTALNIPWVFVPVAVAAQAFRVLNVSAGQRENSSRENNKNRSSEDEGNVSWSVVMGHALVVIVYSLRMLVALRSPVAPAVFWRLVEPVLAEGNEPSGFIVIQALMAFFLFVPWHVIAIFDSFSRIPSINVLSWSKLMLGAELQHAALHVFASLFVISPTGAFVWTDFFPSQETLMWFVVANSSIAWVSIVQSCTKRKLKSA